MKFRARRLNSAAKIHMNFCCKRTLRTKIPVKQAVIVSTARTPIGKAYRGGFNSLAGATLGAASVSEAVRRAGIDPGEVEDVVMGCALQQGATPNFKYETGCARGRPGLERGPKTTGKR